MDLNRPVDMVRQHHYPILKNVRSEMQGRIETRPGLTSVASVSGSTAIHSIRRLNDPGNSSYYRIIGDSTAVYGGTTSFASKDTGYSGNPLAMVPFRPHQATASWMFLGDSSRMRKINSSGTVHQIGMPMPTTPISANSGANDVVLAAPTYKNLSGFDSDTGWTSETNTTVESGAYSRVNTTITAILYDTGNTGWCIIDPADLGNIGAGAQLLLNSSETVVVHSVSAPSTATTIAATNGITYDSGTTGPCTIVLTDSFPQIVVDGMLYNSIVAQYARITSVLEGPDGTLSIRTSTASQWSAGNAVAVVGSFRVYCVGTFSAA